MEHYAGIDVSLECSSVCVVDAHGKIVTGGKVASEPAALIEWFRVWAELGSDRAGGGTAVAMAVCGDEGGGSCGRAVGDATRAQCFQDDAGEDGPQGRARDRRLMRLGWFRPVHCKSMDAQETRAMLSARKLVQSKLRDIEMSLRGDSARLRAEGGKDDANRFAGRVKELVGGHPTLQIDCRVAAGGARGPAARVQRPSRSGCGSWPATT